MTDEETPKKFGKVEDVEIEITKVSLNMNNRTVDFIDKITFETNKGKLTIKPKEETAEFQDGFEVVTTNPLSKAKIPDIVKTIAETIKKNNKCLVKVSYSTMDTQVDGEDVIYRFLTNVKQFDDWEIIK